MHIFTVLLSFPRFPQTADISKRTAMPLSIRFRLAEDLSTLSRVAAEVRALEIAGLERPAGGERPFASEAFKVCACTFTSTRSRTASLDALA